MSDSLATIDRATSAASELLHRLDGLSESIVRRSGDPDPCSNWSRIVDDSAQADWIAASVDAIRTLAAEAREAFTESESAIRSASTNGCRTARMIDLSERLVNLLAMLGWLDPSPCEPRGRARRVAAGVVASLLEERTHGGSPVVSLAREIAAMNISEWLDGIRNEATKAAILSPVADQAARKDTETKWSRFLTPAQWRRIFARMEGRKMGTVSASTWQRRRDAFHRHPDSTTRSVAFDRTHFEGCPIIDEIAPAGTPTNRNKP